MNSTHQAVLDSLYRQYIEVIKPLIALWESREEKFMLPVFNEVRAFNDHIARCYANNATEHYIEIQLKGASRHINRMMLDCYKYLNTSFKKEIEKFEEKVKNVDLSIIDNGDFVIKYKNLRNDTVVFLNHAKILEHKDISDEEKYNAFETALNSYMELSELVNLNFTKINWAKAKSLLKKYSWILSAIASGLVSILLADMLGCKLFENLWHLIFKSN